MFSFAKVAVGTLLALVCGSAWGSDSDLKKVIALQQSQIEQQKSEMALLKSSIAELKTSLQGMGTTLQGVETRAREGVNEGLCEQRVKNFPATANRSCFEAYCESGEFLAQGGHSASWGLLNVDSNPLNGGWKVCFDTVSGESYQGKGINIFLKCCKKW